MSAKAIVTMTLILAFVWGGFLFIVVQAVRAERQKKRIEATSSEGGRGAA